MNALWISRMCAYKNSPHRVESAKRLVRIKIERQAVLLRKYHVILAPSRIHGATTLEHVFLEEARVAKQYWRAFGDLLPPWVPFGGRKRRAEDAANRLLDIGYHHIINMVKGVLERHRVNAAIGLLHVARTARSAPLAFDCVEMFRSDLVDAEVLSFLRLRKKAHAMITPNDISRLLHNVNRRCERKYYLKDFKACRAYRYYIELQILKLIKAVNHNEAFEPLHLPTRHDTRCSP